MDEKKEAKELPILKEKTIKTFNFYGFDLTFRKASVGDSPKMNEIFNEGHKGMEGNLRLMALFMDGYKDDYEKRLNWLRNIEIDDLNGLSQTDIILFELGVIYKEKEEETPKKK